MPISHTLNKAVDNGFRQGSPEGPTKLGFFDRRSNAENVFVLVAHYSFEGGVGTWPRPGNDEDVQNLKNTFDLNRNCRFRDLPSPKKEDLLALLANEQKLKRFFASEDAEPSVFIFIILSHGGSEGKIYTDEIISNVYDSFNTKQLFAKLEKTFANSLRLLFLGPCRGELSSTDNQDTATNYSSKVSFEQKMHNTIIFYSTVETTTAGRNNDKGTWLVQCLCEQLNLMRENESIAHFSTGMQNRIHEWAIKAQPIFLTGKPTEQTMEIKMFPHDRKFFFSALENCRKVVHISGQRQSRIEFNWMNPQTKSVLRGKLAAIFHQGWDRPDIRKLQFALQENLGFETKCVNIDTQSMIQYFLDLKKLSSMDYACFAAFFYAEICEENEQISIYLGVNERKPIGELIYQMLNPEWREKPKLIFLINQKYVVGVNRQRKDISLLNAPPSSGWLIFIIQNKDLLTKLMEIFESKEIKGERSLQECLCDLLIQSNGERGEIIPQAMLVSTLPHSLHFPQNFIKPDFKMNDSRWMHFGKIIEEAVDVENNRIWLLSSLPASGKTTVMSEIALELRRRLCGVKVFNISLLQDVRGLLSNKKVAPSLVTVISSATRVDEEEIEILIKEKRIVLMFDGFDEICPFRRDAVLNLLQKAVDREIPIWISTRPQEEYAIRKKLGSRKKICTATILPLEEKQQIELLKIFSKQDVKKCESLIENFERNGCGDILSNPLHLKMMAQIEDSFSGKDSQNLFNIYEKIVQKKMREALAVYYTEGNMMYEEALENCEKELQLISLSYLNDESVKDLKYPRNGIMTLIDGNIVFVHQTFAEFLAAQNYIECLKEKKCKNDEIPFDLLERQYRQVRKFVEMKIFEQDEETPILRSSLELVLSENLTNKIIIEIIIGENLPTMFSLFENQICFSKNGSKAKFYFEDGYQILKEASSKSEEIALKLLNLSTFESLEFSKINEITKILCGAVKNNFLKLFAALVEKCSTHGLIENCRANDKEMFSAVCNASSKNHHEMLKLVIERGLIDMHGEVGSEALKTAVFNNSVGCVELLIQHGVPTGCLYIDIDGLHPKCFSAENHFDLFYNFGDCPFGLKLDTARALLRTKSEKPEKLAIRLFNYAIKIRNVEVAKFLQQLYRGIERIVFYQGKTALHVAAEIRQEEKHSAALEMCRWLVEEFDLKIGDKNDDGWNALHNAIRSGNLELAKYFLEKDPALIKSVDDSKGHNLLQFACDWRGGKKIVEYIHSRDGDLIKQKTKEGKTALHLAAEKENLDSCVWLVENKVDLGAVDYEGWNAAHYGSKNYSGKGEKILMYLHKKKPELIKQKTILGETVLHIACKNRLNEETIEWLMAQGFHPHYVNEKGWNALHFAASGGKIEKMKFIHEKCPNLIESLTNDGENAMHLMAKSNCDEDELKQLHSLCGKLAKQKTNTNKTVLHYAAQSDRFSKEKFQWLVEEIGLQIESEDNDGWTVVHFTANNYFVFQSLEILEYIKTNNSRLIKKRTRRNETALHIAAMEPNYRAIKWLLKNGVDPDEKNVDGKTALQVAQPKYCEGLKQIFSENCPPHPIGQLSHN
ncbi:uncharacterized protein LOC132196201 isoform X2 [Neocloeon triangulifer]|uniref:uncharacterized protein LOC132196201 isoform X2 n=1 Tax=Neocloeon triangulifer TaxID=2078957 RepID=UPI00286ECE22|nr:uncharacterized protein LOC132196201 isoform X2 [Neocloeon triangulifer]